MIILADLPPPITFVESYQAGLDYEMGGISNAVLVAHGYQDQVNQIEGDGEGGHDTVVLAGDDSIIRLGAPDTTDGQSGYNNYILVGRNDFLTDESGYGHSYDTVQVLGSGATVDILGDNTILLSGSDAHVTIDQWEEADRSDTWGDNNVVAYGSGKETVTGGGAEFSFTGASGKYDITGGGAESATISGGSGGGTFTGGFFQTAYQVAQADGTYRYDFTGDNVITAGTQASTVVGGAHGTSVLNAAGAAHDTLIAGEYGQDTITAGDSTVGNLYEGYAGTYAATDDLTTPSLVIQAGRGNDTLVAGSANETISGGAGNDLFRFTDLTAGGVPGGGMNTLITDFTPGVDKIDLVGIAATSEQIVAAETIRGGSTYLHLPNGMNITLAGVTDLSPKNFTHS